MEQQNIFFCADLPSFANRILHFLKGCRFVVLTGTLMFFSSAGVAGELSFSKGPWTLKVDESSGALLSLWWNNKVISSNSSGKPLVDWGPEWLAQKTDFKNKLVSHLWDTKSGNLTLHAHRNNWFVDEIITLGTNGDPDLLGISVKLVYSPEKKTEEPAKFDRVILSTPIPKEGRFLLPGKRNFESYDGYGLFSSLKNGTERQSAWGIPPLLIELNPVLSLIFMPEYRKDITGSSFKIDENSVIVQLTSRACGWAYPNEPQNIGPFYLSVFNGNLEQAFTQGVWKVYDDINLKAVSDTPDWFRDAVIYSFQPGGTIGSGWKDLGGFVPAREELLPHLRQLGVNTLWMLPIEDGYIYWPRNYYKLQEKIGSEQDLKEFVDVAHRDGMKILLDSVPHGGTPEAGKLRGNKPWELIFDEKGDAYRYWGYDFGNPEWQTYIAKVVKHYMNKYNLDGYRIDAIIGSHRPNWRKKNFPSLAQTPQNVPDDWWRSSLEQNGGKLPPLPYEHASLTCRQGGLEMLQAIRGAVKRSNSNGAVLAEVDHAPYMQDADAIFNFPLALTLSETATKMSFDQWAASLARWLDELNFANPQGTRWLQYFGSHDHLSPFGWVGVNETKALMAVTMLIDGIPMIYHDQDVGIGIYLKRLIAIRMALPELRRGQGRYAAAAPGVFSAVRHYHGLSTIGLVNLSPDSAKAKLKDILGTAKLGTGRFSVWTPDASVPIAIGTAESLKSLEVDLQPWGYDVLACRPEGTASPFSSLKEKNVAMTLAQDWKNDKVSASEMTGKIDVSAPAYSLSINKADGQVISFSDQAGKPLLEGTGFIVDTSVAFDQAPVRPNAVKTEISKNGSDIIVAVTSVLPSGSTVSLSYRCGKDSVRLEATVKESGLSPRLGIAFAAKDVKRWQVASAEGLLDDFFTVRHTRGTPSRTMPEGMLYYRHTGTPVMWQATTNPLAVEQPSILAFLNDSGVELSVCDPLSNGLRNAMVLDKLGGKLGWHAAFFWRDIQPGPQTNAGNETKSFSIVMKPITTPLVDKENSVWTTVGDVKLRNVSRGWMVENGKYSVELLRCGGTIRSLRLKSSGLDVLDKNEIYTDKGFRRKWGEKNMFSSSSNDGETGVRIWREGERLHMHFSNTLRGPTRRWLLDPMVWASTEYVFDGSSSFKIRWSLTCDGKPNDIPAFLAWKISSENWMSAIFLQDGKKIASGLGVTLKTSPLPDTIRFQGRSGENLLRLSKIRYPSGASAQKVVLQDANFYIACLDGDAKDIEPGKTYETSLTMTVGE